MSSDLYARIETLLAARGVVDAAGIRGKIIRLTAEHERTVVERDRCEREAANADAANEAVEAASAHLVDLHEQIAVGAAISTKDLSRAEADVRTAKAAAEKIGPAARGAAAAATKFGERADAIAAQLAVLRGEFAVHLREEFTARALEKCQTWDVEIRRVAAEIFARCAGEIAALQRVGIAFGAQPEVTAANATFVTIVPEVSIWSPEPSKSVRSGPMLSFNVGADINRYAAEAETRLRAEWSLPPLA